MKISGILGLFTLILSSPLIAEDQWREFTSIDGRTLVAKVLNVTSNAVTLQRKTGQQFALELEKLTEEDQKWLKSWKPGSNPTDGSATDTLDDEDTGPLKKSVYPRDKKEIRASIGEILKRPIPEGIDREAGEAVNLLNVYRNLCGVPDQVQADATMNEQAKEAAEACDKHGSLSHEIGHFTNKCNLSGQPNSVRSVQRYMEDSGSNNRDRRGHRKWCLNPPMGKTGFGGGTKNSAMVAMDSSGGGKMRDSWAYPGKGFFPIDYLHGNGWSVYLTEAAPEKDKLTVEVFELRERPESPPTWANKLPGNPVIVGHVATFGNAINFEPAVSGKGIYWIRVRGGGVREQYLVELF